jgi:hypothetical protein
MVAGHMEDRGILSLDQATLTSRHRRLLDNTNLVNADPLPARIRLQYTTLHRLRLHTPLVPGVGVVPKHTIRIPVVATMAITRTSE